MDCRPEGVLGQRPAVRRAIDDSGSVMRFRIDAIAPQRAGDKTLRRPEVSRAELLPRQFHQGGHITGIALQHRLVGAHGNPLLPVLFLVYAAQVEFLRAHLLNRLRRRRRSVGGRHEVRVAVDRISSHPMQERLAVRPVHLNFDLGLGRPQIRHRHAHFHGGHRRKGNGAEVLKNLRPQLYADLCILDGHGREERKLHVLWNAWRGLEEVHVQGQPSGGFDKAAVEPLHGVPEFREGLHATRCDELRVHLRLVSAGLDFIIRSVVISEQIRPNQSIVGHAPRPRFLPQDFPKVRDVHYTVIRLVVVGPKKVAVYVAAKK